MTALKIATWNVNSLKVRLPQVLTWLQEAQPEVLALQELKLADEYFPHEALRDAGYVAYVAGQKTYNGVATLVRANVNAAISNIVTAIPILEDAQRRVMAITLGDIRILNLYVPNGESVSSLKYQYKLNWLQHLNNWLASELKVDKQYIVLGDFNIAPQDIDVHDPKAWHEQVLCSTPERQALQNLQALGLKDCFRELYPEEQAFSWWDYRLNAFKRKIGLRIDLILASTAFFPYCTKAYIDQTPRSWERPSDHTPVIAEFMI
jgi:exodeoxyribonuclease III